MQCDCKSTSIQIQRVNDHLSCSVQWWNETKRRKLVATNFRFFSLSVWIPANTFLWPAKEKISYDIFPIAVIYTIVAGFGLPGIWSQEWKRKLMLLLWVFFFFLSSTASQLWLLGAYEIVVTFFGLWMRPQSSHTKFLVPSPQPNSPTRIVSRLSSRMWISMADGKPDKIANCIVTSCGFSPSQSVLAEEFRRNPLNENICFWRCWSG